MLIKLSIEVVKKSPILYYKHGAGMLYLSPHRRQSVHPLFLATSWNRPHELFFNISLPSSQLQLRNIYSSKPLLFLPEPNNRQPPLPQPKKSKTTATIKMGKSILLLNGPNLNLLGTREPHIYGHTTLSDIEASCRAHAASHNANLDTFQSNHEGTLVDRIQAARSSVDGIIINPGAFTHTSVAIRDALLGVRIPFVELHVSNVHAREPWRHHSYFSDKASGVIVGLGVYGYKVAVEHVILNFPEREQKAVL